MKINLKNLGLLDEANFEIGDFTIICGENNTGKTYATYAFYGFWKKIYDIIKFIAYENKDKFISDDNDKKIYIDINLFQNLLKELPELINKYYQSTIYQILAGKEDDFKQSICNIEIEIFEINEIPQTPISLFQITQENKKIYFKFNDDKINSNNYIVFILLLFIKNIPNVEIISVERTGALMFYKELNLNKNNILEAITRANEKNMFEDINNILKKSSSRYPKPVTDNIETIQNLDEIEKNSSFILKNPDEYKNIIDLLWQIIGGKYIIDDAGIKFATGVKKRIGKNNKVIALQQASSSVKALMLLNFYVLNSAKKGDILIIDEPELNLHPKNQILLARLFVMLINAGIKIFITTHSDYIIREISNCICLNNLENENISNLKNYSKNYKLESHRVKAYIAKNEKGKNILENVKITQTDGIFMDTFNEVIDKQNQNQEQIYLAMSKALDGNK